MIVLGVITLWGLLSQALRDDDKFEAREQFLIVYVLSCLGASAYGLLHHRVITVADGTGGTGLERYLGTQDDPNYMAMLLCIGLCFLLALPLRQRLLKLLMAVALVASIALTGSLTGLACTMVVLALYAAFRSGKSAATVLVVGTLAMGLVVAVVLYVGSLDLLPHALQARADEALLFVSARDYTQRTSGRSDIQGAYLDFFWAQGAAQVMLGGFGVSAFALEGAPFTLIGKAPHNSFIDVLLTCGVVGASVFVILIIVSFVDVLRRYRQRADPVLLSILLGKVAWVMFATSISVFPSLHISCCCSCRDVGRQSQHARRRSGRLAADRRTLQQPDDLPAASASGGAEPRPRRARLPRERGSLGRRGAGGRPGQPDATAGSPAQGAARRRDPGVWKSWWLSLVIRLRRRLHAGSDAAAAVMRQNQLYARRRVRLYEPLGRPYDVAISWSEGGALYTLRDKVDAAVKIAWIHPDYRQAGFDPTVDREFIDAIDFTVCVSQAGHVRR